MKKSVINSLALLFVSIFIISACSSNSEDHPRIYVSDEIKADFLESANNIEWKKQLIETKKANLDKYIEICKKDPEWLVSRLQMNWKTRHSKVYLRGGKFSHSEGEAPVPTVRFSGSRDWATDYLSPDLEEVEPYFDDPRGMYLEHKTSGVKEWVHPSETGHIIEGINRKVMVLVQDAAFLYWLTGEEKYAMFAAPVFFKYIDGMYHRDPPEDLNNSGQQGLSGLATFEVIHEQVVVYLTITYDFLHNYFQDQGRDLSNTVAVFQRWGDQIIKNGVPENNWNLFQARYLTYLSLALDDDENYSNGKGQQHYLRRTFDESSTRQIAIKESLLVYDQENGIWPESPSYSIHVNTSLLRILTLLDNVTNGNELAYYPIIEKAGLAAFQYLFPSGYSVGFGDANHRTIPPENFELLIWNYRKYKQKEKELMVSGLLNQLIEKGQYIRKGESLFQLFFYVDSIDQHSTSDGNQALITPTFYAPNVSMFVQRMGTGNNAMMVSTVGSFGNHAHANGISIELFANNYVVGPDMGRGPSYWHPYHREYYARMPAHNTVVVDGISDYQTMMSSHPYTLDNHFPISGVKEPYFNKVSFNKVSFVEPKTQSDQQRLTAMINTASGKGYILDIFRSKKKLTAAQKHDYFYHNLGQSLQIIDNHNNAAVLKESHELGSHQGNLKAYDYLTDERSMSTNEDLVALFRLDSKGNPDNLMKLWIKGSMKQKVYTVLAPESNALSEGTAPAQMLGQKIPTLILRRDEEAWKNPFVVVFNPYFKGGENPISKVSFGEKNEKTEAQIIHISHSGEKCHDEIIGNTSENDIAIGDDFYQKGLFSVTRINDGETCPDFIFVSGMYRFENVGWEIIAGTTPATVSIEKVERGLALQNDKPVLIRIPISDGFHPDRMDIFEEGKVVEQKEGMINRSNPDLVEFRLAKPYKKAVIYF
jgi:hypothetical protein